MGFLGIYAGIWGTPAQIIIDQGGLSEEQLAGLPDDITILDPMAPGGEVKGKAAVSAYVLGLANAEKNARGGNGSAPLLSLTHTSAPSDEDEKIELWTEFEARGLGVDGAGLIEVTDSSVSEKIFYHSPAPAAA